MKQTQTLDHVVVNYMKIFTYIVICDLKNGRIDIERLNYKVV